MILVNIATTLFLEILFQLFFPCILLNSGEALSALILLSNAQTLLNLKLFIGLNTKNLEGSEKNKNERNRYC